MGWQLRGGESEGDIVRAIGRGMRSRPATVLSFSSFTSAGLEGGRSGVFGEGSGSPHQRAFARMGLQQADFQLTTLKMQSGLWDFTPPSESCDIERSPQRLQAAARARIERAVPTLPKHVRGMFDDDLSRGNRGFNGRGGRGRRKMGEDVEARSVTLEGGEAGVSKTLGQGEGALVSSTLQQVSVRYLTLYRRDKSRSGVAA